MDRNLRAYLRLDLRRYRDRYAVLVDGKVVGSGKNLKPLLRRVEREHPGKIPAVARIPGPQTLILRFRARL